MRRVVFTPAEQEQARNLGRKPGESPRRTAAECAS